MLFARGAAVGAGKQSPVLDPVPQSGRAGMLRSGLTVANRASLVQRRETSPRVPTGCFPPRREAFEGSVLAVAPAPGGKRSA